MKNNFIPEGYATLEQKINLVGVKRFGENWQGCNPTSEEEGALLRQELYKKWLKVVKARKAAIGARGGIGVSHRYSGQNRPPHRPPQPPTLEDRNLIGSLENRKKECERKLEQVVSQLQQDLYAERLKADILDKSGSILPIPNITWGRQSSPSIFRAGEAEFWRLENGRQVSRQGRVLFLIEDSKEDHPEDSALNGEEYEFRKTGEFWAVRYQRESVTLKSLHGIRLVSFLLLHPGTEFWCLDIKKALDGNSVIIDNDHKLDQLIADDVNVHALSDKHPVLDRKARENLSSRLESIEGSDLTLENKHEKEWIENYFSTSMGIGWRSKNFSDDTERARKSLVAANRKAIESIENQKTCPELAAHLRENIKIGIWCSYKPEPPISWKQ